MSRRRRSSEGEEFLDLLVDIAALLPWWLSAILTVVSYFVLHYLSIKIPLTSSLGWGMAYVVGQYLVPLIFLLGSLASIVKLMRGKELLSGVESRGVTEALSKMSWQDFEVLMGAWFKTQGYDVAQAGGAHADGGIDIELRKNGELYLVQCKHYRAWKVPVDTVRDLYGVMTSRGAVGGFVVTSGRFTTPAEEFASGRVITLIDGEKLAQILKLGDVGKTPAAESTSTASPKCPVCASDMVRRTARHGSNSGKDFWGCTKYPACKGIVSIN